MVEAVDPLDEVLQAVQAGDVEARQELGRWLNARLRRIFSARFGRLNTDELVQRTALDLLSSFDDGPFDAAGFRNKVRRFAVIERREWVTGQKREQDRAGWRIEHARSQRPAQGVDEVFADRERLALFHQLIDELAPSPRKVLLARLAGYKFETIAAALGMAQGTARKYASEAKRTIVARWEAERVTPAPFRTPDERAS